MRIVLKKYSPMVAPGGYNQGYSDFDIEFWNLNQMGAPSPNAAGWVLTDLMDGDLNGEIDF